MEEQEKSSKVLFGLVGKNISYSFSKTYFSTKFKELRLANHQYVNFDLEKIEEFSKVVHEFKFVLKGVNVTIPYKQEVFLYLDKVHKTAKKVGAVNTIRVTKKGRLQGYNTDVYGFQNSITPLLQEHHKKALILGTGGASKAVAYVFKQVGITYLKVSRDAKKKKEISYEEVNKGILNDHTIIVNCTPLGTFPNLDQKPTIPYEFIDNRHLLYDLIYNPEETAFLSEGKKRGAQIKNGYEMLKLQAEESWRIWNK